MIYHQLEAMLSVTHKYIPLHELGSEKKLISKIGSFSALSSLRYLEIRELIVGLKILQSGNLNSEA